MKKIVGILAAAAMVASVFAVDFTAGFQLKADLFNYNGSEESLGAMKLWNENTKDDKPFIFSISGDRAGGTIKLFDANGDAGESGKLNAFVSANAYNIWFKPFDMLRVDLGAQDIALNKEHVTWWKGNITGGKMNGWDGIGEWGYKATINVDAFTFAVALLPAVNEYWFSKAKEGDAVLGETTLFVQYGADFGTINAIFDAKNTFKDLKIAAGYSKGFGDVAIFADAMFWKNDTVNSVAVDFDARYNKDAFGVEGYFNWATGLEDISKDTMRVACYAKASYALDAGTAFLKFEDDNLIASKFAADITVGFDGNMGALAYEVSALVSVAEKVGFSMPCWFRIGF